MIKYPSIETVFTRGADNKLAFGEIRTPEVALVNRWTISEKIDGTNIRVTFRIQEGTYSMSVAGRTDAAQLPPGLETAVLSAFSCDERGGRQYPAMEVFDYFGAAPTADEWSVTFYGEGYGAGIQKGGGQYNKNKAFRCFDIRYGGGAWEDDSRMREICADLDIPVAPLVFNGYTGKIPETREELFAITGYSSVAWYDSGNKTVMPEGIVAKPTRTLLDKYGNRVMWKLTYREFKEN